MSSDVNGDSGGPERRSFERLPVTLVVEYQDADDLLEDYTVNLSVGGMFVHTERDFSVDTEVSLILSFPGLLKPVKLSGVVRWASKTGGDESGIGIEFKDIGGPEMAQLRSLVESLNRGDSAVVGEVVRVLIVEDNSHVARLIENGLRQASQRTLSRKVVFEFAEAHDGQTAIALLEKSDRAFDVAIVDMYLPIVLGVDVVRFMQGTELHAQTPLIGMSGGGVGAKELAHTAGCQAFLDKPFRLQQLIGAMQRVLWGK